MIASCLHDWNTLDENNIFVQDAFCNECILELVNWELVCVEIVQILKKREADFSDIKFITLF